MPQILAIAFSKVVRTSPRLPPSAIRTSAMGRRMPGARQHHADVVKDRGDRRMRLVDGDLDRPDARKRRQDGIGHRAGGALQQLVIGVLEGGGRGCDHVGVRHGIDQPVGERGFRQVRKQFEIDHKALSDLGLVVHHAMAGMDHEPGDENAIGHRLFQITIATRSACTVSATSWLRMIFAPFCAAIKWAAIEPPRRCCGSDGETVLMKRLREAPTRMGRPNVRSSPSRASAVMLCSGVLPKPMPGSSTIFSAEIPAVAATSSERVKNATMSFMMSIAGSARSRLCMTITGSLRSASNRAMRSSRCSPQISLAITAP